MYAQTAVTKGDTVALSFTNTEPTSGGGYGSPDLSAAALQVNGYYYICSADGTAEPNGTGTEPDTWHTGDWVIWNDDLGGSGLWQKIDNTTVLSGAGTGDYLARWTDTETLGDSVLLASGSDILMPQYLIHTGDTDTYFGFSAANTYKVHTGGSDRFSVGGDVAVLGTTDFSIPAGRKFYLDGQSNTYITESSDGVIDFYGDGTFLVSMKQNGTQSEVVVNEGSGDVDFRVEANNSTHAFFVEAESTGKVGILTSDPLEKFDTPNIVIGGSTISGTYRASALFIDNNAGQSRFYSTGADGTTYGSYKFNIAASDGDPNAAVLTLGSDFNATFGGNVDLKADNVSLDWMHGDADQVLRIEIDSGNDAYFSVTGNNDFYFRTNSTTALTINGSQNATFAGDVTIGALTSGETAQLVVNHEGGASPVAAFMSRTNRAKIKVGDNDTTGYLVSENGIYGIGRTDSVSANNINIDASHNVGIRTITPAANLDVQGGIIAGGKTMYTLDYSGGLTTTGNAVAGLSTGSNGHSAVFIFTCSGGDGYQRIVYSCKNVSGTWDMDKDIDEGVNAFDVTYAADGSDNITFTFKARSSTQSYWPKVTVEAMGNGIQTSYIN